jgi:hypothetical protein
MSDPVRTCVGCGGKKAKAALVRLVVREGKAVLAPGAEPGRGAYLCGAACLRRALDRTAFPRAFRRPVAADEALAAQLAGRS